MATATLSIPPAPSVLDGGELVFEVSRAIQDNDTEAVRKTVGNLIEAEGWRYFRDGGRDFRFDPDEFGRFVESPADAGGLGTTVELIRHHLIGGDLGTLASFDRLTGRLAEEPTELPWVDPQTIGTEEPFISLFRIDEKLLGEIRASIRTEGYDRYRPVDVWTSRNVVVEGHTRLIAAIEEKSNVTVAYREFADEDAALRYALAAQILRRNLTDAELVNAVRRLEYQSGTARPGKGRPKKNGSDEPFSGPTARETAKAIGANPQKVKKIRAVIDHPDPGLADQVSRGVISINAAHEHLKNSRKQSQETTPAAQSVYVDRSNDDPTPPEVVAITVIRPDTPPPVMMRVRIKPPQDDEAKTIEAELVPEDPKAIEADLGPVERPTAAFWKRQGEGLIGLVDHVDRAGGFLAATAGLGAARGLLIERLKEFVDAADGWLAELENVPGSR